MGAGGCSSLHTLHCHFDSNSSITLLRNLSLWLFAGKSRGNPILLSFSAMRKKVSKACPEHFTSFSTGSVEGKESPTPLYRPIITPQHLWLECYFFFVSSNKEKVTKKACLEQGRWETNCYLSFVRAKER